MRFWSADEKEVVVGNADESQGIELVIVKNAQLVKPRPIIWKKDGVKMRRIPVFLEAHQRQFFYMDRTEVTVGQFKKFLQESEYSH